MADTEAWSVEQPQGSGSPSSILADALNQLALVVEGTTHEVERVQAIRSSFAHLIPDE